MAEKYCAWCGQKKGDLLKVKNTSSQWAHRGGCMQSMEKYGVSGKPKPAPSLLSFSSMYRYDLSYVIGKGFSRF